MTAEGAEQKPRRDGATVGRIVVAVLFGLLYAYDLFEALSNLVGLPAFYSQLQIDPAAIPWPALIAGVVLPPLAFAVATWVGRRESVFRLTLLYTAGLASVAALSLTLISLAEVSLRAVLG